MNAQKGAALLATLLILTPVTAPAANHREAPITALDRLADITDWYTFVSYDDPSKVTMILNVDPLLEPSNGPNYFPFDPEVLYVMNVDNDKDGRPDLQFEFRFTTELRLPGVFTGFVGVGSGVSTPANSPAPVPPGTPLLPPAITALDGPGSAGLGLRQSYTVTMVNLKTSQRTDLTGGRRLFAVPTNVGPRTMPDYPALARQGVYSLPGGVKVFAGTVDDPFYIDLGGAFDTLNLRLLPAGTGVPGVLTAAQDENDTTNFAADMVSGFNVNSIAIEVPISLLTRTGRREPANSADAVIGTYGQTLRQRVTVRRSPDPLQTSGGWRAVQRMGNPLINELLIGTGSKDRFSMDEPANDAQFASFLLDPLLARALNAATGGAVRIPAAPRLDLLPLVTYAPPIAPPGTAGGPVADLLRLNTGIGPTAQGSRKRLGFLAGDNAGFPNGRRVSDDVTDIALRAVSGLLAGGVFAAFPNNRLGDGVNANDVPYQEVFPYVGWAQSGKDRVHRDPGENGLPVN